MSTIQILPSSLQNQIAAGEVVERPASIVKELLENSLDAGATHIEVRFEEGGIKKIQIRDNGKGMNKEDAMMAPLRYATSKIKTTDDLYELHSFGFRGEALASIASVSKMTIQTKLKRNPIGTEITFLQNGEPTSQEKKLPDGTTLIIENLFHTIPARKKFLKSETTESKEIIKIIEQIALAHPHCSFEVFKDDKNILDVRAQTSLQLESLKKRIGNILGQEILTDLLPLQYDGIETKIRGFCGHPHLHRATRDRQFLFVNDRPIHSDTNVMAAILRAYDSLMPHGRKPVFILFIDIYPEKVDVNVHPRKSEVKFVEPKAIFEIVKNSFDAALSSQKMPSLSPQSEIYTSSFSTVKNTFRPQSISEKKQYTNQSLPLSPPSFPRETFAYPSIPHTDEDPFAGKSQEAPPNTPNRKVIGQLRNSFILIEEEDGLRIVDQHAAHERVRYETLIQKARDKKPLSQKLLHPVIVPVSSSEKLLLEEHTPLLKNFGFEISEFSETEIIISSIPSGNENESISELFKLLLADLSSANPESGEYIKTCAKMLATYDSCRGSIKFGDALTLEQMEGLILQLESCNAFYSCAHGRPIFMKVSYDQMEKECGR